MTRVVGAVPVIVVLGLDVADPPVMSAVVPAPDDPSLTHWMTLINLVRMECPCGGPR